MGEMKMEKTGVNAAEFNVLGEGLTLPGGGLWGDKETVPLCSIIHLP